MQLKEFKYISLFLEINGNIQVPFLSTDASKYLVQIYEHLLRIVKISENLLNLSENVGFNVH